jgi:hypothetical protein
MKTLPTQQCYLLLCYMCHCQQYETLQSAQYSCLTSTKFGFSWQIFIKVMNTKFHRNLSIRSHSGKCRQMDTMKLIDASQNYAHTTKNLLIARMCLWCKSIKYYECVYFCLNYPASRSHVISIVLYGLCGSTIFLHMINSTVFGKTNYWIYNVCFDFLYNSCLKHLILRSIKQYIINVHRSSCEVPIILVRF